MLLSATDIALFNLASWFSVMEFDFPGVKRSHMINGAYVSVSSEMVGVDSGFCEVSVDINTIRKTAGKFLQDDALGVSIAAYQDGSLQHNRKIVVSEDGSRLFCTFHQQEGKGYKFVLYRS